MTNFGTKLVEINRSIKLRFSLTVANSAWVQIVNLFTVYKTSSKNIFYHVGTPISFIASFSSAYSIHV